VFVRRCGAAPRPLLRTIDDAGSNRVVEDVLDGGSELSLVPDHGRPEAFGKERAEAAVTGVVLARVVAVEPLHRPGELLGRAFDDHVVVRGHQAPALQAETEAADRSAQMDQEQPPVDVVSEERRVGDAASSDVEIPIGKTRAKHAPHPAILAG
jgi:hypothetical protein